MHDFKLHGSDELDGTKGKWRPAIIVSSQGGIESVLEMAVVSCPGCGCPFGVGGDGVGNGEAKCRACGWEDAVSFGDWAGAPARARFEAAKRSRNAAIAVAKARQDGEKLLQAARAQADALVEKAKKT